MLPVNQYKNWEEHIVRKAKRGFRSFLGRVSAVIGALQTLGSQNFTVMLIPHSERKVINFKISVLALAFIALVALAIIGAVLLYSTSYNRINQLLVQKSDKLETAQVDLDQVREQVAQLQSIAGKFEASLNSTLGVVGVPVSRLSAGAQPPGESTSFLGHMQENWGAVRDVDQLKDLRAYLSTVSKPVAQIGDVLSSQKSLLVDIPSLWPLQNVKGWITTPFGPAIHPFTGQWYLHKGIDIAQRFGTPIVATANGRVTRVDYEALGYGNYIDIKHKYGFLTKYGHLSARYVTTGQEVVRGQVIAAMGATGLATGPHLHYEIRIGDEAIDPTKYLLFSTTLLDNEAP